MKVLITGATSAVGQLVTTKLESLDGCSVRLTDRGPWPFQHAGEQ